MMKKFFNIVTTSIYLIVSLTLVIISMIIIFYSIIDLINDIKIIGNLKSDIILSVLETSGAIIIAAAVIDVSKYMFEEEVLKNKDLETITQARQTLTKIIIIISIAVAIEGLIYIFKAGVEDIRLLIYPSILMVSSTVLIVGLAIYHKLTKTSKYLLKILETLQKIKL